MPSLTAIWQDVGSESTSLCVCVCFLSRMAIIIAACFYKDCNVNPRRPRPFALLFCHLLCDYVSDFVHEYFACLIKSENCWYYIYLKFVYQNMSYVARANLSVRFEAAKLPTLQPTSGLHPAVLGTNKPQLQLLPPQLGPFHLVLRFHWLCTKNIMYFPYNFTSYYSYLISVPKLRNTVIYLNRKLKL